MYTFESFKNAEFSSSFSLTLKTLKKDENLALKYI